jgi:hypothetical protein
MVAARNPNMITVAILNTWHGPTKMMQKAECGRGDIVIDIR